MKQCKTCQFGQYWKQYSCEVCNESDKIGNGVFCVSKSEVGKGGTSQEIVGGTDRNMTVIISVIAVTLGIVCIVLAVLMMRKQKKEKTRISGPDVRYSAVLTPNVEYSDWPEGAGPSRLQDEGEEDERSWCAEWSNFTPGSGHDENIYSYLDSDRVEHLREQI